MCVEELIISSKLRFFNECYVQNKHQLRVKSTQ